MRPEKYPCRACVNYNECGDMFRRNECDGFERVSETYRKRIGVTPEDVVEWLINIGHYSTIVLSDARLALKMEDGDDLYRLNDTGFITIGPELDQEAIRCIPEEELDKYMLMPRQHQLEFAIETDMELCDFEDWQVMQELMTIEMPYTVSSMIEGKLSEYDLIPRDMILDKDLEWSEFLRDSSIGRLELLRPDTAIGYLFGLDLPNEVADYIAEIALEFLGIDVCRMVSRRDFSRVPGYSDKMNSF